MYVSDNTGMLYLASALYNPADMNSTSVYGLSTSGNMSIKRSITINGMQHVTGITEDPASGSLLVAGFNMDNVLYPDPYVAAFYYPYLAQVPYDSNSAEAVSLSDSHDLGLPTSIVWTNTPKYGGADVDGSGSVTFVDFVLFVSAWLSTPGDAQWDPAFDISTPTDGIIDMKDFNVFGAHWQAGVE